MLTEYMYSGNPIIKQKKSIHTTRESLLSQGFCIRSTLLTFCVKVTGLLVFGFVGFFEETDVFIKSFGSVEDVEIVFCNYKFIEFMVSERFQ